MSCTWAKKIFIGMAIGFFTIVIIFTVGCAPKRVVVVYDKDGNSEYPEVGHTHKKGGPPPHAPAHGYRAKYHYRYYPDCSVYYDSGREVYFYIKGDHWEVGASLPRHLQIGLGDSVSIELDTDKPYIHHAEHIKNYPPGQMKKKNKHKWG